MSARVNSISLAGICTSSTFVHARDYSYSRICNFLGIGLPHPVRLPPFNITHAHTTIGFSLSNSVKISVSSAHRREHAHRREQHYHALTTSTRAHQREHTRQHYGAQTTLRRADNITTRAPTRPHASAIISCRSCFIILPFY